jgi:sigma-B regulation protein RsbU (phosphoserine phosphatase)
MKGPDRARERPAAAPSGRPGGEPGGGSLAIKLVVTLTLILAVALGAAGYLNFRTLTALAERTAAARRAEGERAMEQMSMLLAQNVAVSSALLLADGAFSTLDPQLTSTVKEDPRLQWILIADAGSNRVVSRTASAPDEKVLADALSSAVLAAPAGRVISARDPEEPTRFTFGTKIVAGDRTIGQLRLGVSTAALEADLARAIAAAHADAMVSAQETLLSAGIILVFGIVAALVQGFVIARPLRELSAQAHRIAEGDLHRRVNVRGRDEIGRLGQDFNFMADRLGALLVETASKASLEKEMSLARSVQESMNPSRHLQEVGPCRIVGSCEPATSCGGDWWTLRRLSGDRLLIVVGDVTGHGIPSAMVAATARGAVEALSAVDDSDLTPEAVLRAIHSAIRGVGTQQLLMTCFAAVIDPVEGLVTFSNAGHNFPYVVATNAEGSAEELGVLALRGSPLGNVPGEFVLTSGVRPLPPGAIVVFFTDGVIDRVDGDGNRFGDRRLRHMLLTRPLGRFGAGLTAARDHILTEVASFSRGAPADDDITIVLVQYDPVAQVTRARREAHA